MKKHFFLMAMMAAVLVGLNGCKDGPANGGDDKDSEDTPINKEAITTQLSAEETKEHLMKIANGLIGRFKTQDQKAAFTLMDDFVYKFEEYEFDDIGEYYEDKYNELFRVPRYICDVLNGQTPAPAMNYGYTFSFENESVIWEADDNTRTWVNQGPSSDNSVIFLARDKSGNLCEAKFWGEGSTKTYSYSWKENGDTYTATGVLPEKLHFTFKQGSTQLANADIKQDMQKNHHATFNFDVKVTNLRWKADLDIRSTSGTAAFEFFYGQESLMSALVHLPDYKLIDKSDSQSYEDWIEQYEDRYEYLLEQIGDADAVIDIFGMAQAKINITKGGKAYADIRDMDRSGVRDDTQDGAQRYCDAVNKTQTNGIYFNSDIKQADIRMIVMSDYGDYWPEPVLYFPIDATSYSFEQYFDRQPFTNLETSIENLANSYVQLSKWLKDNVGDVDL